MSLYARIQDKLAELNRTKAFRVAVASVLSLAVLVTAGRFYLEASELERLAQAVPEILKEADLKVRNAVAVELVEKGTVVVGDRTIGDAAYAARLERLFEESGKLERLAEATALLIGSLRPAWLPVVVAEDPSIALVGAVLGLAVINFACFSGLAVAMLGVLAGVGALNGAVFGALALLGAQPRINPLLLAAFLCAAPVLLFVFALIIRILLLVLDRPSPMFAVAGGVVREAMRLRIAVAFAAVAVITIPAIPLWLDASSPVRYQVQTFLSRSIDTMYIVCAFLTVFLGCATVAFEIRDRQAWMTLTKPVSRLSWLAGKWLGLVALNAAIIATCSLAIFGFLLEVRSRTPSDIFDALAVQDEVLVARVGSFPEYQQLTPVELQSAVEEAMKADLNLQAELREGTRTEIEVKKQLAKTISEAYFNQQRAIGPGDAREYRFSGLEGVRDSGLNPTLRYKFYSGESSTHERYPVVFIFGGGDGDQWTDRQFIAAQSNVVTVPASSIADGGTLVVRVLNAGFNANAGSGGGFGAPASQGDEFYPGKSTIVFDPDGLELLYPVDTFSANFVRAQLVNLIKLGFLGMLSVVCASILNFPVACLVVFTVFAAGSIGPFLTTSIAEYRIRTDSGTLKALEALVKVVASATEYSVRAFADARANGPLVEGRLVAWSDVFRSFALLVLGWCGVLLLSGFALFRRKELAIYSGQGG
ncbi:MAG: hypothetical protein LW636_04085 [Planctomycetaceae bacterium]|nr:hypothetical protein [Planctomycetaceae bacterium]